VLRSITWSLAVLIACGACLVSAADTQDVALELVGQLGGIAHVVEAVGDLAFLGQGPRVFVFDISLPEHLVELGRTDVLPGAIHDLAYSDDHLYVATGSGGLRVISVSNPEMPVEIAGVPIDGDARGVDIAADHAYVASSNGLYVFSLAPALQLVQHIDVLQSATMMELGEGFLVVGTVPNCLYILSLDHPALPVVEGVVDLPGYSGDLAVLGEHILVSCEQDGLRVVSVADPQHPEEVAALELPSGARTLNVIDDLVYVGGLWGDLCVVSLAEISGPHLLAYVELPSDIADMVLVGDHLYMADRFRGLQIFSLLDPLEPVEIATADSAFYAAAVSVSGDLAFIASGFEGVQAISVEDPRQPVPLGNVLLPDVSNDVVLNDGYALALTSYHGLHVISVEDPALLEVIGHVETPGYGHSLSLSGETVYIAGGEAGVHGVSIFDPTSPTLLTSHDTPGDAVDLEVVGDRIFVADSEGGVRILSGAEAGTLEEIAAIPTEREARGVFATEDAVYIADHLHVMIFPMGGEVFEEIGRIQALANEHDVIVQGSLVFVEASWAGVSIFDLSEMASPRRVATFDTAGRPQALQIVDDLLFVADGDGGLLILRIVQSP